MPLILSLYYQQLDHWLQNFDASQFVVAPMKTYFKTYPLDGDQDLAKAMGSRLGVQFPAGAVSAVKPRENENVPSLSI